MLIIVMYNKELPLFKSKYQFIKKNKPFDYTHSLKKHKLDTLYKCVHIKYTNLNICKLYMQISQHIQMTYPHRKIVSPW